MIAIVSSISILHSFGPAATAGAFIRDYCKIRCQTSMLCRLCSAVLICCFAIAPAAADDAGAQSVQPSEVHDTRVATTAKFLSGAAIAFGLHESGHLVLDVAFDASPHVKKVEFGGIPFFAIAHRSGLSPRREFAVSSAGFWVQHATDEWLLSARPGLRGEQAPFVKGILAFNVLTSVGYSMAAFAKVGPYERDTRGMADAIGVDERAIGCAILAPALLDAYRYYRPESKWAKWMSRAVKAGGVLLILK